MFITSHIFLSLFGNWIIVKFGVGNRKLKVKQFCVGPSFLVAWIVGLSVINIGEGN